MKSLKLSIIIIVTILIIVGALFYLVINHKPKNQIQSTLSPTQILVVSSTPTPTANPIVATITPSKYSAGLKAQVRNEFISQCHTQGHYEISVCNCVADYLAKNYSETELAKMYIQYHTWSQISNEVKTAANTCSKE